MTFRRLQLEHVQNVPHHTSLIDELLFLKVSCAPHPQTPQTIILESTVLLVLSTAGSKALFIQCRKKAHEEQALIV